MAVVSVKSIKTESSLKSGKPANTVFYQITVDAPCKADTLYGAAGLPQSGDTDHGNSALTVTDISIRPNSSSPLIFDAEVTYSSDDEETTSTPSPTVNPLTVAWDISYSFSEETEQYFIDCATEQPAGWSASMRGTWPGGTPVTNSAGDRLPDMLERESGKLIINIGANVASYSPLLADQYKHTVNSNSMTIDGISYDAGTLKLSPITGQRQTATYIDGEGESQTVNYWRISIIIKVDAGTWVQKVYDRGYNQLVYNTITSSYGPQPILDNNNMSVKEPVGLNGSGTKLSNPNSVPAVLTFRPYKWMNWSILFSSFGG